MPIKQKEFKILKPTVWWKRFLAYCIDNIILFIILILFVFGIYGENLAKLLKEIHEVGGFNLIKENNVFSADILDEIAKQSANEQNITYWLYVVQNQYAQSIFILNQILSMLYLSLFWWNTGQTIGCRILKIKVISPNSLNKIPILSVFLRVVSLKLIEIAWGLPSLIVVNPMLKQRFHDSISRTVVVDEFSEEDLEKSSEQLEDSEMKI